jgi:hypothetical protein
MIDGKIQKPKLQTARELKPNFPCCGFSHHFPRFASTTFLLFFHKTTRDTVPQTFSAFNSTSQLSFCQKKMFSMPANCFQCLC